MIDPASLDEGWIDAELAAEFPELRLATTGVQCVPGRSVEGVRAQLRRQTLTSASADRGNDRGDDDRRQRTAVRRDRNSVAD